MPATSCRSLKERNLFVVALLFSIFAWLGLVISLIGLLYAPFVAIGVVVAHALLMARITGHAVRVGSRQLPELHRRVERAAQKLGLAQVPEVYITSGGGILNAFATKLFSRSFVILHAEVVDACEALDEGKPEDEPGAIDFLLGHELGHLALGHLAHNWLLWPAKIVPLLGAAYSRACEYSCDACGLAVVDNHDTASRALALLAAGGRQARRVNLEALIEQRHDTGSLAMALVELNSSHPYLSKRVAALHALRNHPVGPEVGRNPVSYVLAPFFNFAFAITLFYAGIIAAIAIPNFIKYQERAALLELQDPNALPEELSGEQREDVGGGLDALAEIAALGDDAADLHIQAVPSDSVAAARRGMVGADAAGVEPFVALGDEEIDVRVFALSRRMADEILDDPVGFAKQVDLVPVIEGGETTGFKVYRIKPGSLVERLGLKNGDFITHVNGTPVALEMGLGIVPEADYLDHITVRLQRDGKPVLLDIRGAP